jgi:hypothetical protein
MVYPAQARMHVIAYIFGLRSGYLTAGYCRPETTCPRADNVVLRHSSGDVQLLRRLELIAATFGRRHRNAAASAMAG